MKKIKTDGNQVLSVPNTDEGQQFLYLLSKFANHKRYRLRKKGRGGNGRGRYGYDTPLKMAKWIAVYVDHKVRPC